MPAPTSSDVTLVMLKTLLRNTRSGRIAASPTRRSQEMKPTRETTMSVSRPRVSPEPQPHSRPFSATSSTGTTDVVSSAAPRKSTWASLVRRGRRGAG